MSIHTITDEFTGLYFTFELNNVRLDTILEAGNADCVMFDLKTDAGEYSDFLEWVSVDEYSDHEALVHASTDSHILTNQITEMYLLFPQLKEVAGPAADITPVNRIMETVMEIVNAEKKLSA